MMMPGSTAGCEQVRNDVAQGDLVAALGQKGRHDAPDRAGTDDGKGRGVNSGVSTIV